MPLPSTLRAEARQRGPKFEEDSGGTVNYALRVQEADLNTIGVEKRRCVRGPLEDELQVVDSRAVFLKGHAPAVVDEQDDVEEGELDEIAPDLKRELPRLAHLGERV